MLNVNKDRNFVVSRFDDSKRVVANLMARENITVQILPGLPTASFDSANRVLTLPDWPTLSIDQLDTQIGHEIGHALFTDNSWIESVVTRRKTLPNLKTYVNVIEDTRIERKMREAFPGIARVFYNGRADFTKHGPIFQVADAKHVLLDGQKVAVANLSFIDRINLHYKIGAFIQIPFSADEQKWFPIIDKCYSTQNACEIAERLYALAKEQPQTQPDADGEPLLSARSSRSSGSSGSSKSKSQKAAQDDDDDENASSASGDDSAEGDDEQGSGTGAGDGDDSEGDDEQGSGTGAGDGDDSEAGDGEADGNKGRASQNAPLNSGGDGNGGEEPIAKTDELIQKVLEKIAKSVQTPMIRSVLLYPVDDASLRERTITATEYVQLSERWAATSGRSEQRNIEKEWNDEFMPTVRHMAAEFQRRKSARAMLHARTGRTGRLDMERIAQHKFADDLFKRVTTVPKGQSHGIVMLIDGSSSMTEVFPHVIDQMLLFAYFAFLCNIPFESYMFTDRHTPLDVRFRGAQAVALPPVGMLVGLVNTVTSRTAFRQQVRAALRLREHNSSNCAAPYGKLGGTPLHAGLLLMERHIERLKRERHLDKMIAVVVSDGADTASLRIRVNNVNPHTGQLVETTETLKATAGVVRDTVTKKTYTMARGGGDGTFMSDPAAVTQILLDVIRDRHQTRNVCLYLVDVNHADIGVKMLTRSGKPSPFSKQEVLQKMVSDNQIVVPAGVAIAECSLVLNVQAMRLSSDQELFSRFELPKKRVSDMRRTRLITEKFREAARKAGSSRVFVNSVMPYLA